MKSSTIDMPAKDRLKKQQDEAENTEETEEEVAQLHQIDEAIEQCRTLYRSPLISERTRSAYEDDWQTLRAKRNVDWMRGNVTFLLHALSEAESYRTQFEASLNEAVSKKWISAESRERWWDRFYDPNVLEWDRKEWLEKELPDIRRGWEKTADERSSVLALAKKEKLTAKDIPELADLENIDAFLSFHYLTKIDKTATVKALVLARIKHKENFIGFVRKELEDWAKAGWMHRTKIGPWMKRVMESDDPDEFATKTLWPFKHNWMEVRKDFDRLNTAMDAQGIPRGFRPVKPDRFLLMDYRQRTSYCALAWIRLENAAEEDKELASLKLSIRHNLDTKDWEGANIDLKKAKKMRGNDRELLSMETFLRCHRTDTTDNVASDEQKEEESPDPQKLVDDLRSIIGSIPGSLGWLYQHAAQDGIETLSCLQQIVGNGPWAEEHGFTSEADKVRNMYDKRNKEATKNGDIEGIAHVILDGETATENVINDDCDTAQYLYMGKMGREAVLQKVKKNAGNQSFRYWSILVPSDLSLAMQSEIARNRHFPMKATLRKLNGLGYRFTLSGKVERL